MGDFFPDDRDSERLTFVQFDSLKETIALTLSNHFVTLLNRFF